MKNKMNINFQLLKNRVIDSLNNTDLDYIRFELKKLKDPTICTGVGGSSAVSNFLSKVIETKNNAISINMEPRDMLYKNINGFKNIVCCSYSGNNYGVDLSFNNNLKKYLLSNNSFDNNLVTYLKYNTTDKEHSFISLAATLIPISIALNYYLNDNNKEIIDNIIEYSFRFDTTCDAYEIFTGYDTSTTSKYLETTLIESGIAIPIIHDKYAYCHGRSTISINSNNNAIYLYRKTEFDRLMLKELKQYYKNIIIIESKTKDQIVDDYQMLIKAMYLTKFIAEQKENDLSKVNYAPIVKKVYKYKKEI